MRTLLVAAVAFLAILMPGLVHAQTPPPIGSTPPPFGTTPTPGPPTPTPTPPPPFIFPDRLRNMTYPSEYSPTKQVTLVDGKAEWDEPPLRGVVVFVNAQIGRDFAAVILGSNTGGSGSFTTLHLVTSSGGTPTAGPGMFIGDRTRVESIDIQNGTTTVVPGVPDRVRLSLLTQGPTDPQCCPTQREIREYVRDGNTVRLVATNITQPGSGPLNPPSTAASGPPAIGAITPPKTGSAGLVGTDRATGIALALVAVILAGAARRRTGVASSH